MRTTIILLALSLAIAPQAQARLVIQAKNKAQMTQLENIARQLGMSTVRKNVRLNHLVIDHPTYSVMQAINALHGNSLVKSVEEDRQVKAAGTPTDPLYWREWHIPKIGANTAASAGTGSGIRIAVLDTGVTAVKDLAANLLPGTNIVIPGGSTSDVQGHGTAVAGTIAATCNNSIGLAGIACGAQIMPVVIANSQGLAYLSDIASGIQWAADHGARVIHISYGGLPNSQIIDSAAQYARNLNASIVTAAGNSGNNPGIAANDPYLLTVSATDQNDLRPSFSSYGPFVDLAAPGVSIWTTNRDGTYGAWNGTSLSSPIVAAVEAMMLSVDPTQTPDQVEQTLINTTVDLGTPGYDQYFGYGRVNAAAAVQAVVNQVTMRSTLSTNSAPSSSSSPTSTTSASTTPVTTSSSPAPTPATDTTLPTVSIASPADNAAIGPSTSISGNCGDNVGVVKVQLVVDGTLLATSTAASGQYFNSYLWNWSGYTLGTHTVQVLAFDAAGNSSTATITVNRTN